MLVCQVFLIIRTSRFPGKIALIALNRKVSVQQQVYFNNLQGEKLAATLHLPENSGECGIVLGHCFTCSRHTGILRQIAADAVQKQFTVIRFDFSGNGQSEGRFAASTYSKQISEMQLAAAYLKDRGIRRIGLAGHSMGALISVLTAARNGDFRAVCAIAGRLSGTEAAHFLAAPQRQQLAETGSVSFQSRGRELSLNDAFFNDASDYDLPHILSRLQTPLLIVHGQKDEIIPVSEAYAARDHVAGRVDLHILSEADHMFSNAADRQEVSRIVVEWFEKHI